MAAKKRHYYYQPVPTAEDLARAKAVLVAKAEERSLVVGAAYAAAKAVGVDDQRFALAFVRILRDRSTNPE